jgi:2-hydroxychromene-2-carboxylate isomerase
MDEAIDSDPKKYDDLIQKNQKDQNTSGHWGVPLMVYKGEPFFGQDRIAILKWRVEKID